MKKKMNCISIEKRNYRIYNTIITTDISTRTNDYDKSGQIIRNIKINKRLGTSKNGYYVYNCTCLKCGQELILNTRMLTDKNYHLCHCDYNYNYKYGVNIMEPNVNLIFSVWHSMRDRCNNPNNKDYKYYGGKGIKVCDEWDDPNNGFQRFYKWSLNNEWEPNKGVSIDRIDCDKNYSPNNCRFVNHKIQCNNQSSNHYIQYNQYVFSLSIWAEILNLTKSALSSRIQDGWDIKNALYTKSILEKNTNLIISDNYNIYNKYQEFINKCIIEPIEKHPESDLPIIRDLKYNK